MQSASKGLGHFASGIRSLHAYAPRSAPGVHPHAHRPPTNTSTGRVLRTTRTALSRFFAHLTTPGFSHPVVGQTAGLSTRVNATVRPQTIEQRLSLPARHAYALSKPRGPFLPRPSPASRNTVQVGLGAARNFSTARPIFQQLTQNAPVAGRAIYEADWDLEKRNMKDKQRVGMKLSTKKEAGRSTLRAKPVEKTRKVIELERYFPEPAPAASGVTTVLLVPLAPTPTSRFPLTDTQVTEPNILVISELQEILSSHRIHSLRISSLFARLDACGVWDKGATFSAHGDASGLCTVLRVEFKGWTAAMVRNVMGDAGKGWCRIVEIKDGEDDPRPTTPEVDPAASVVLPTLDFSASFQTTCAFAEPQSHPPSPPISNTSSPLLSISELSYTPTDIGSEMDVIYDNNSGSRPGSVLSFSSEFLTRSN